MAYSAEEVLTGFVHAAQSAGLTRDQAARIGAHLTAALAIGSDVHERVWRAEGVYPREGPASVVWIGERS